MLKTVSELVEILSNVFSTNSLIVFHLFHMVKVKLLIEQRSGGAS
jgi:hypothetical protein